MGSNILDLSLGGLHIKLSFDCAALVGGLHVKQVCCLLTVLHWLVAFMLSKFAVFQLCWLGLI